MSGLGVDKMLVEKYASAFSIPRELAQIVARRYPEYSAAQKFLFPDVNQLYDPRLMPDIEAAANEIIETVKSDQGILIYTHDDVDGYTSAAVVYKALGDITRCRDQVHVYPIIREQDGYILNPKVLRFYHDKGVRLLLTVDFGISNQENFRIAQEEGLKAVICDHHETALESFPTAAVNPKRPDSEYPFRELAGVGVAFKLAQFLYERVFGINAKEFYNLKKGFFPIVCLGTFSDRVALCEENRVFCSHGMRLMNEIEEPWITCLRRNGQVDVTRLLREVIPAIGSAAYSDPRLGVEFFIENNPNKVVDCYDKLRETDLKRRQEIDTLFGKVVTSAKITSNLVLSLIPLSKQHYLGSVAARLREYYRRNSIIIGVKDEKCVGELRSCDIDLYRLLNEMRRFFIDFGGHKKAAGFSINRCNLDAFLDEFVEKVEKYSSNAPDGCNPDEATPEALLRRSEANMLEPLMPFGEGNPAPVLTDGVSTYTVDNALNVIEKV